MTRDQIRNKVADIIMESIQVNDDSGLWGWYEAADEIMKLWDRELIRAIKENARLEANLG